MMLHTMAECHIVLTLQNSLWVACYSDAPDDKYRGVTMQEAVNRLQKSRGDKLGDMPGASPPRSSGDAPRAG